MIDLHCDTISALYNRPESGSLKKSSLQVDLEKLKQGHSTAQFFAMFVDMAVSEDYFYYCNNLIRKFYQELALNNDCIVIAHNFPEYLQNCKNNKVSAFLTIEEGAVLNGDLTNVDKFYQLGVRLITLTWNYTNEIGYPNFEFTYQNKGLTSFGKSVVREMNRLGMIVDVSHLSDQGFYDVAKVSAKPFVASHSNSRAVVYHSRNLTDDMIRVLAEKGGVIGINFSNNLLSGSSYSYVEDMIRHIKHIYQIGGSDVLALGSDFDGIHAILEIENIGQIDKLFWSLKRQGFKNDDIEKLSKLNCLRVIKECLI